MHSAERLWSPRFPSALWPEHEQHRLMAHFAKLWRIYECGLGDPAKPRQDCNILLTASLEGHGRSVEAGADINLPKLLKAGVVIGSERSIDQAREEEAAGRREGCAVIWISFVDLFLYLTGKRIDDDDVGLVALGILVRATRYYPIGVSAGVG